MIRRTLGALAAQLLAVSLVLVGAPAASAATGPYTLPFFDPLVKVTQWFGCTGNLAEPAYGSCAHWHAGIDYNLSYDPVASSRAGTVKAILESVAKDSHNDPRGGNYVLLDHGGSRYSLYYHLEYNAVWPAIGAGVSAGQHIARSGNTGQSSGPHLHYALTVSAEWWKTANAINPEGQWTTSPGRVPWLADYHSESNGGTEVISQGMSRTHWVKFRNSGGRPWAQGNDAYGKGAILLAATDGSGTVTRESRFQARDWLNATLVTPADEAVVVPGGIGTFTFNLTAAPPPGWYTEYFNLRAKTLWWFDHARLGNYYIPIQVTASPTS